MTGTAAQWFRGSVTEPRDIPLPRLPAPPSPYTFPVLATLAPVVASLAMWAITRSPFALMFAVLGPLVAIGSLIDSRWQGRRRLRRDLARFEADAAATMQRIDGEHGRLRESLWRRSRASGVLLPAALHDAERWRHVGGAVTVVIGVGERASALRLTGGPDAGSDLALQLDGEPDIERTVRRRPGGRRSVARRSSRTVVGSALLRLRQHASVLRDAPVTIDARLGIGICGPRVLALAAARGIVIQLADALPPAAFVLEGAFEPWHGRLPHATARGDALDRSGADGASRIDFVGEPQHGGGAAMRIPVVIVDDAEALPRECRIGFEIVGGELRMLRHPELGVLGQDGVAVVPQRCRAALVSALEAGEFAATLTAAADVEGVVARPPSAPPGSVALEEVWQPVPAGGLAAAFAVDGDGPVVVDLVADGPHAVVGGTTGSGKSELLIGWVLALARSRSPEQVSFLLVDFKGGSSFAAVAELPHCVGLITDLDHASARRALDSLRAELRQRERLIAAAGVRAIEQMPVGVGGMPRLVVVVDEFAAMVSDFPELHALFADIAARGRSLGVHLILCTQRPGGVLRDSVMANCTLRLSLRVNNGHDSTAVVGTDAAASLPRHPVGRCLLSSAGAEPRLVQVALAHPRLADDVASCWGDAAAPRRPWLPPLPIRVVLHDLPGAGDGGVVERDGADSIGLRFGLLDVPDEQRQPPAVWSPVVHGNLLTVGGHGAGKSSALDTISAVAERAGIRVLRLEHDIEAAWDTVAGMIDEPGRAAPGIVVIDDLDALVARFPDQYASVFVDRVAALLREGPASGVRLVAAVQRLTPSVQSLASLFDSRLLLRSPSRQEHVMAGGDGAQHDPAAAPGRGRWRGVEVQVALADGVKRDRSERRPSVTARRAVRFASSEPLAIVTARPAAIAAMLDGLGVGERLCAPGEVPARLAAGAAPIAVGDPQGWQTAWAALGAMKSLGDVVFDRCTTAEFRMVSGVTALPPPLSSAQGGGWMLARGGDLVRVQLPA